MEKITMEEALAEAAWELAARPVSTRTFEVTLEGEIFTMMVEPSCNGVVVNLDCDASVAKRQGFFWRKPLGIIFCDDGSIDYPLDKPSWCDCEGRLRGSEALEDVHHSHPYFIECSRDACDYLGAVMGIELPDTRISILELFARNYWRDYPESFYEDLVAAAFDPSPSPPPGYLFAVGSLPRDGRNTSCAAQLAQRALGERSKLSRCKSVRRALAARPLLALAMGENVAFSELTNPDLLCSFARHPDALSALDALRVVDTDGQVLSCVVDVFGEKPALKAIIDLEIMETYSSSLCLIDGDAPDVWFILDDLRSKGTNAKQAMLALPTAWVKPYEYSDKQLALECSIGTYDFRLPADHLQMARLGQELHNCLRTCVDRQSWLGTVVYVSDRSDGGRPIAALEVDLYTPRIVQAYLSCNRQIPAGSDLDAALGEFKKVMWDASMIGVEAAPGGEEEASAAGDDLLRYFDDLLRRFDVAA